VCCWSARRKSRGCIYARYSTKYQQSIEDQVRVCREWAEKNDVDITEDHVFTDRAVTGKSHRRDGMNKMLSAIQNDEVDVDIDFATNRIYRKTYRSMQFAEEEIGDRRKRCVFVSQNLDTDNEKTWRSQMQLYAMMDELHVQMLGGQVRAAQQGLALRKRVYGSLTFGYRGIVIPGPLTRMNRPPREWDIDPAQAPWVLQVFRWFTEEGRLGYAQIARRLRQSNVPPPPQVHQWTAGAVRYLLANRRYIGDFSFGWTKSVWQNKASYSRQFRLETPQMAHQDESLRIVDDGLFFAAQRRASSYKGKGGRKRKGTEGSVVDHLLKDLLWCPTHNRPLTTRGANGEYLACRKCKDQDEQTLVSIGNRNLIQRLLCEELARRIQQDANLVKKIIDANAAAGPDHATAG
jgi:site-specific DNA recombinase